MPFVGDKSTVSRILKRERSLTIAMDRKLHKGLGIPGYWRNLCLLKLFPVRDGIKLQVEACAKWGNFYFMVDAGVGL